MTSRVQFVLSLLLIPYASIDGLILSTNLYMRQTRSIFSGDGRILRRLHPIKYLEERQEHHHQRQHSLFSTGNDSMSNYDDEDEDEKNNSTMVEDYEHQRHVHFMTIALKEAERAKQAGEVPIGAVVVQRIKDEVDSQNSIGNIKEAKIQSLNTRGFSSDASSSFRVLSRAGNNVERNFDASAHAELLALRDAARVLKNWRLQNCVLYSTLEPCPMCLAAAQAFRVEQIVYGAPDMRLGAHTTYMKLLDDYQHPYHTIQSIVPGVLDDESSGMLRDFFRSRRREQNQKQNQLLQKKKNNFEGEDIPTSTTTTTQRSKRSKIMKHLHGLPLSLWKRVTTRIVKITKRR